MSGITREALEHAVDKARQQSYAQYGHVYAIDPVQFADLMIEFGDLGIEDAADAPQPPVEVAPVEVEDIATFDDAPEPEEAPTTVQGSSMGMSSGAVIVPEEDIEADFVAHVFRVDRGGINCITCHKPESEGNHSS